MKKYIKYFTIFIIMLFLMPVNSKAAITYGINGIMVTDTKFSIKGWAYIPLKNFCNYDNPTYKGYKGEYINRYGMPTSYIWPTKCNERKGYDSVKYILSAVPSNANLKTVYAKNSAGMEGGNLRTEGISATCVNYYKLTASDGLSAIHCDGEVAPFGEFPTTPINYLRRNYNVDRNAPKYKENGKDGTFFYDDIGFSGEFDLNDFEDGVTYTIYLKIVHDKKTYSSYISVPKIVVVVDGLIYSNTSDKSMKITSSSDDILLNYSPNWGYINQDKTTVYYKSGDGFAQFVKTLGGGYFSPQKRYNIKDRLLNWEANIVGNKERLGGFDFYNLGTTGSFSNYYTSPGNNYDYYAISPWLSYKGILKISKTTNMCNRTVKGTVARKNYCNATPRPSDYDICCDNIDEVCGGTDEGTPSREKYCADNPRDTTCCNSHGTCPVETDDKLKPVSPTSYTYWNSASTDDTGYRVVSKNGKIVKDYPKYCAATDSTSTMITTDDMLKQYNNAFCYQKGSFTTNSPNKTDYILTYSGGAYSLNVDYNTELVCVSLANRRVTNVRYYDDDCNYMGRADSDSDVFFKDDENAFDIKSGEEVYTTMCEETKIIYNEECLRHCTNDCDKRCGKEETKTFSCKDSEDEKIKEQTEVKSGWEYTQFEVLDYNRNGKFFISNDDIRNSIQKIPSLYLMDTTEKQNLVKFSSQVSVSKGTISNGIASDNYTTSSNKNTSLMKNYITEQSVLNPNFSDPLEGHTKKSFVQKIVIKKYLTGMYSQNRKFGTASYRTNSKGEMGNTDKFDNLVEECSKKGSVIEEESKNRRYGLGHYYGDLAVAYEDVSYTSQSGKGCGWGEGSCTTTYHCVYKLWYEGEVTKTMYVTIEDTYKEESMNLNASYTLNSDSVPDEIKERFEATGEKYVSQVNLSDYYQITLGSSDYNSSDGKYFGVAGTWNMDKALCALDLTDHDCDPNEETCACKYDKKGNLEKGVYYSDCLDFRVVSVTSLFPGKESSLCVNPTSNCRQPGRNWLYVSNDFKRTTNFDYTKDKPMYHITLSPSTMNKITNDYREYYTDINLGGWYNPSKCTYNGNSRCSSDYESSILNELGSSVFTRNYDIINTRYRALKNMPGVNVYKTSKIVGAGD